MPQTINEIGPLYSEDNYLNLYYLNETYKLLAEEVSAEMRDSHKLDIAITSGIWGGTYLIANAEGQAKNKVQRLYCIINIPQGEILDKQTNKEKLVDIYRRKLAEAFRPYQIILNLEGWGGRLPYSNHAKPSFTMHLSDANRRVRWLRTFFIWNTVPWEESIIHDTVRNLKVLKELLNLDHSPVHKSAEELKFLLQDVIITYRTLENALSEDFIEHAEPLIEEMVEHFLAGLHDPELIQELYMKTYTNAIVYGLEETLEAAFMKHGFNIHTAEDWPVDKINWVPPELKEKLIPPIKNLFAGFKETLEKKSRPV